MQARSAVGARLGAAVIDELLAIVPGVPEHTLASIFVNKVNTCPAVEAHVRLAVVDVNLASFTTESRRAEAGVAGSFNASPVV